MNILSLVAVVLIAALSSSTTISGADAFQIQQRYDSAASSLPSSLRPSSRRDVLVTTITATSSILFKSQPAQAKDDSMNYQAVWNDPKHPNGYRVLFGDDEKATLLLRDEPSDEELIFPVKVVKEEGKETRLLFDFGSGTVEEGVFTRNRDKIRIISFNDSFWINKKFEGPIGVYKDSTNPKRVIIMRQIKGSDCVVEFRDNGGKNGVTSTFTAKAGSTFTVEFPERGEVAAVFNLFRRNLTFEDGTVWTKY